MGVETTSTRGTELEPIARGSTLSGTGLEVGSSSVGRVRSVEAVVTADCVPVLRTRVDVDGIV